MTFAYAVVILCKRNIEFRDTESFIMVSYFKK